MRQTDDIAPLVDIAEQEFNRLILEAQGSLNNLRDFWTKLYGPSEVLSDALDDVRGVDALFYSADD